MPKSKRMLLGLLGRSLSSTVAAEEKQTLRVHATGFPHGVDTRILEITVK